MSDSPQHTGYARLRPLQARLVLAALVVMSVLCVTITLSPIASGRVGKGTGEQGDTALFRAMIDRVHAGEGFYQASAAEMPSRRYPTRSVFNWRTPVPIWLIGKLPDPNLAKGLMGLTALALMVLSFEILAREQGHGLGRPIACALLLTGPMAPCALYDQFVSPMSWAAVFIALSICGYGLKRPAIGIAMGLAAVCCRELVLPYCCLAAAFAWWYGRRRELLAWISGLAVWALFYGLHCWQASQFMTPEAVCHREGWIQFGGLPFVIALTQMNLYLLFLPQWATALYFVAAMLGLAGWHTELGQRVGISVCLFVLAFAIVGQEFNQYWGLLIAPLFCFGVVRFPLSVRDLWVAAHFSRRPVARIVNRLRVAKGITS